jgi:hypothetical protein
MPEGARYGRPPGVSATLVCWFRSGPWANSVRRCSTRPGRHDPPTGCGGRGCGRAPAVGTGEAAGQGVLGGISLPQPAARTPRSPGSAATNTPHLGAISSHGSTPASELLSILEG